MIRLRDLIVDNLPDAPALAALPTVQEQDVPPTPFIITAAALMRKEFPEPRWAVSGLFPEGLTLVVGKPKLGKSWLALNAAIAVACGGYALGRVDVDAGEVLYLALEDTERRLQERLAVLLDTEAPDSLHIATEWPTLADGAVEHLNAWLSSHPATRLVVIDTFQRLRGPVSGNQNAYASDYTAAGELKRVADRHGIAVVVVHHTRKAAADDPLDTVSGTNGLAGAADTIGVMQREIGRSDATLYLRGRDVPEAEHALGFDAATCSWTLLGDAADYRVSEERREIITQLRDAPDPMSPKAIADALGKKAGAVRFLLHKMAKAGEIAGVGGAYTLPIVPANTANTANGDEESAVIPGKLATTAQTRLTNTANGHVGGVSGPLSLSPTPESPQRRGNLDTVSGVSGVSGGEGGDLPATCQMRETCEQKGRCRDWLGLDCAADLGGLP